MARGGKRDGAGRKTKAEEAGLAALIDSAVSDADWIEIFKKAAANAKRGNVVAARFIAEYRFGRPTERHEISGADGGPIKVMPFDYASAIAPLASRPDENSDASSED